MLKDNLIHYRNKRNMSQEELASKSCVSRSSIALYEKGIRNPSFETITLICNALNISVNDLIEQRSLKRSIINFFLCIIGLLISIFPFFYLLWDRILEDILYNQFIFETFRSNTILLLTYIFSLMEGILMYYLLFSNLKKSKKKTIITIVTLPIFILFLFYSINQKLDIFKNIPDNIISYIFIPLLILYYFFVIYFIIKNLILESKYIKERLKAKTINLFNIVVNIILICLIVASIAFVYTTDVKYYYIETLYYEYGDYQVVKIYEIVSLLSIMYTRKIFSLLFQIFQICIIGISLINLLIKDRKKIKIFTMTNLCLSLIFVILWIVYPRIFGQIIEEIRFIPCGFDC